MVLSGLQVIFCANVFIHALHQPKVLLVMTWYLHAAMSCISLKLFSDLFQSTKWISSFLKFRPNTSELSFAHCVADVWYRYHPTATTVPLERYYHIIGCQYNLTVNCFSFMRSSDLYFCRKHFCFFCIAVVYAGATFVQITYECLLLSNSPIFSIVCSNWSIACITSIPFNST